jgi:Flp pilus assembly protein TadD
MAIAGSRSKADLAVVLVLVASLVTIVHWPVLGAQAHALDDDLFVTNNTLVRHPGWPSVGRFFGEVLEPSTVGGYYLPVSMTSLMLDYALGGRPNDFAAFHRTSLLLHVLNVVLLAMIFESLLGSAVPAGLAALWFGLHPLTVEPIAWVSDRKTLLSTFFAFAAILTYVGYARGRTRWFPASVACYALALLSKPSVTTLPLILLVLDGWPLKRLGARAFVEKWPFYLLTVASVVVTTISQVRTAPITPLHGVGLGQQLLKVCYLVTFYAGKLIWPVHLSPMYQPPLRYSLADPLLSISVVVTIALAIGVCLAARRLPGVLASALIFVLALSPTFLILKWSYVIAYDRYLYFPGIGLALLAAYLITAAWTGWAGRRPARRNALIAAALGVAAVEAVPARAALAHWSDSVTLWSHVVKYSPAQTDARFQLGISFQAQGDLDAAAAQYLSILRIVPDHVPALANLGAVENSRGNFSQAVETFERVCRLKPDDPFYWYSLGMAEKGAGRLGDAEREFRRVLSTHAGDIPARVQLGTVLVMQGRASEGIAEVRHALALAPGEAVPHYGLGMILLHQQGVGAEAVAHFEQAVRLEPEWPLPATSLAWIRATSPNPAYRDPGSALKLATRAVDLTFHRDPAALDARAAALASCGRFEEAVQDARSAIQLSEQAGHSAVADSIRARLDRYASGAAYIDPSLEK